QNPVWDQIRGVFRAIDKGKPNKDINAYNGGLFEYDEVLDNLIIKDELFNVIYDISDYDFDSDVDVNVLGHIFEQSITDIEKLKSEIKENEFDKNKSRRKKEGIYYTPQYITSYIVENAVGGYLEDIKEELGCYDLPDIEEAGSKSWKTQYTNNHLDFYNKYEEKLNKIKVLDPACGSGAFLNQAFDYLLQEHRWLNKQRDLLKNSLNKGDNKNNVIQMSLTTQAQRYKQILKINLYGVDLNEESVEITKLSLWLKTANKQKPLTNLDDNIKCGNSLVDETEIAGTKAFKWSKEFPDIVQSTDFPKKIGTTGFDVIIGNPPWGAELEEKEWNYCLEKYKSIIHDKFNTYITFIQLSLILCKRNGYIGMITPNTYLRRSNFEKTRSYIMNNSTIDIIVDLGEDIFEDAVVPSAILISKNNKDNVDYKFEGLDLSQEDPEDIKMDIFNSTYEQISINSIKKMTNHKFLLNKVKINLLQKLEKKGISFKEIIADMTKGIQTGMNDVFIVDSKTIDKYDIENSIYKKILFGRNIQRYKIKFDDNYLLSIPRDLDLNRYPNLERYLLLHKDKLKDRSFVKKDKLRWFDTTMYKPESFFQQNRVIMRRTGDSLISTFDNEYYNVNAIYNVLIKDKYEESIKYKYLLALLNSKLSNLYYHSLMNEKNRTFAEVHKANLLKLPIIKASLKTQNKIIENVEKITPFKYKYNKITNKNFNKLISKYASKNGKTLSKILEESNFRNEIYSGRATKVRNFTVNINTNIITLYSEKSSSGKYELIKFEENDKYKRRYLKLYLENLIEGQLEKIDGYSGNILEKVLKIEIPDYNKNQVVRKVVKEWDNLQKEINKLEDKIEKTDNEIDRMVYELYGLTEEEIKIVRESITD
ncbi:MAG: N-6 DNA methylase, partial [Candidatus Lokiarchaeota archaeon]|nr:N-6 DNA methylase [Candidatus Lokiarchaeota archaeon]